MTELLNNLAEFVKMIFAVIVTPNYGASNTNYSILRWLIGTEDSPANTMVKNVLLLTFGIMVLGVSIGMLKRLLCKN